MNDAGCRFAVVIPAYNEEATIRGVSERALAHSPLVIVVDDGSTDGTRDRLAGLPVVVLANASNVGKASSLCRGAGEAIARGARLVLTIDADGQHDPDDIPLVLAAARARPGAIVVGSRLHWKDSIPKARYLANRFANFWIAWAAGTPISDSQSGFRAYPAHVFTELAPRHGRWWSFVFESEVLIAAGRAGVPIACVPVRVTYQRTRRSHFRPVVDIAKIAIMLARRLFSTGMNLPGLVRSLRQEPDVVSPSRPLGPAPGSLCNGEPPSAGIH